MLPIFFPLLSRTKTLLTRLSSTRASNLDNLDAAISAISPIASVQYSYVDMTGATTATATVASVNTAKSVLVPLGVTNAGSTVGIDAIPGITLTNSTTVTGNRHDGSVNLRMQFVLVAFK